MQYDQFVGQVQDRARLADSGAATAAIRATLETLGERIPEGASGPWRIVRQVVSDDDARRDALRAALRRNRVGHIEVSTDGDWLRTLGRGLR
jgi:hypothetical protein